MHPQRVGEPNGSRGADRRADVVVVTMARAIVSIPVGPRWSEVTDGSIIEGLIALWSEFGFMTKLGLFAQAATCGLIAASIRRQSRPVLIAALVASIVGLFGLSLLGLGEAEYVICGSLERPTWCGP